MANDTYRSTPAFTSHASRADSSTNVVAECFWRQVDGDRTLVSTQCVDLKNYDDVNKLLADAHVRIHAHDRDTFTITVRADDIKKFMPPMER